MRTKNEADRIVLNDVDCRETSQFDDLPPIAFQEDDGGGHADCDWNDSVCTNMPEYYILHVCDDLTCKKCHVFYYCKRHYLLCLGMTMHALRQHANEYDSAKSADERRVMTLRAIADFGRMG